MLPRPTPSTPRRTSSRLVLSVRLPVPEAVRETVVPGEWAPRVLGVLVQGSARWRSGSSLLGPEPGAPPLAAPPCSDRHRRRLLPPRHDAVGALLVMGDGWKQGATPTRPPRTLPSPAGGTRHSSLGLRGHRNPALRLRAESLVSAPLLRPGFRRNRQACACAVRLPCSVRRLGRFSSLALVAAALALGRFRTAAEEAPDSCAACHNRLGGKLGPPRGSSRERPPGGGPHLRDLPRGTPPCRGRNP
jgi:hypothetical protein